MARLNQIIAIAAGKKTACGAAITQLHKLTQRVEAFTGFKRTYQPLDEEGEQFPSENKKVQHTVTDCVQRAQEQFVDLLDIIATQEYSNCDATADLVVDGQVLLSDVPVTYLLFLEKRLDDVKTFISKLPTLSTDVDWQPSASDNRVYTANLPQTTKTKKIPRVLVKAAATEHHPAQTEVYPEDVVVGHWTKVDESGAIPATKRRELLKKVDLLREGVKMAREEANSAHVENVEVGDKLMNFVFGE